MRPDLYIDGAALADRLTRSLASEGPSSMRLEHHTWPGTLFKLYLGDEMFPPDDPSRVALLAWLMAQPDDSVQPDVFYARAIRAADGNVEKGLAIAWDVLRESWDDGKHRNDFPRTKKLVDITGERDGFRGNRCSGMQATLRGDNFSAWYHMTGTALLAFLAANGGLVGPGGASVFANRMVDIEEAISGAWILDTRKRVAIDRAGVELGRALAVNLQRREPAPAGDPQRAYLYDNPAVYGDSWRTPASGACDYKDEATYAKAAKRLFRMEQFPSFGGLAAPSSGFKLRR